jgi:PAS domain S-box-containing protein
VDIQYSEKGKIILLLLKVPANLAFSEAKVAVWQQYFELEAPISPYDEIKRKNDQLKELSEKLLESERRYQSLTDALPLMIFTSDNDGKILYLNRHGKEYFGLTEEQLLPGISWANYVNPEDIAKDDRRQWEENIALRKANRGEYRLRNSHGEETWHQIVSIPLEDATHFYRVGFCVDIEAHKRMEKALRDNRELQETKAQLERYQEELELKIEELNKSNFELSQFAYVASHDLQEPLRKIIYYSDYLQKKYGNLVDEQGAASFFNMFTAALRMKHLIHDLLTLSRIRKEGNYLESTDLNRVVQEALQDLEMAIAEKGAQVQVTLLPVIKANPAQMRQLFENIISNAIKYCSPDVQPLVHVSALQDANGSVQLSIRDNGIGFQEKYLEKIFSLFQRLHTRDKYEGTGIGLTISKKIVELHNGSITATSTPGAGSTFIVTLPVN